MRIAFVTPVWKGSRGGGILTYSVNLIEGLKARGHSVDVYALDAGTSPVGGELRVAEKRRGLFVLKTLVRMLPERYDAILCNESRSTFPAAAAYALLHRVRVVYVVHSFPGLHELGYLGVRFYSAPFALQDRGLLRVVFVSEQLKRYVAQTLGVPGAEHASVIRAAAPPRSRVARDPVAVREFRRSWGVQDDDWLVLGLGLTVNDEKAKGAAVLIQAISRMRSEGQRVKLMLTRKGYPLYWLQDLAHRSGLDKDVIFTREIQDPMLALNACDLYAHIVFNEGLPVSVLEAMTAGKPILASRRAGIPEAVEDGVEAVLVEPEVDAIVTAMRRLLQDAELRARLGEAARSRAASQSWETTTSQFLALLGGQSI